MPDKGHKMTDDMIAELEQKLHNLYAKADSDLQKKAASRLKKYNETVKVKEKTLDKDAFETWKKNQAYMLSNQKNLVDTITEDLVKTDQIALDIINDYTPSAYALNYNYGTYQIEDAGKINTSFALYNHDTVELLALYDDSSLLPEKKDLDIPKDLQWNKKHLSQAIAQGVLQGESIDKIAKRLSVAVGMDENGAIRNARTMMTAAQNGGRVDAYLRGKAMGIELQQKWQATEDSRTRKSHRAIDGEVVEVGEEFSNHCHFPGDPAGPGREVYNCRCTLIPLVNGIKDFNPLSDDKYIKKDFEDWLKDQADPYIVSKFGDKSLNKVYHQLLDEKGSKIGNYFYNHVLGDIGKSSQTWKDYINGTLDTANTKKIDDYLFKHFDLNANKLDDAVKTVDKIDDVSDIIVGTTTKYVPYENWDEFSKKLKENTGNWLTEKAKPSVSIKNSIMSQSVYSEHFDIKKKLTKGELTNEDLLKYTLQKYGGDDYKKLKNDPMLLKMFDNLSDDMKVHDVDIYRGINLSQSEINKLLKNGTIDHKGISSWSLSDNEAVGFALSGKKQGVILHDASGEMHDGLNIDFVKAKSLQDEKEVLISPKEQWKITGSHYEHKKYINNFGDEIEGDVLVIDVVPASKVKSVATKNVNKVVNGKDISATWQRRPDQFDFEIEDVINTQGFDGLPRVVDAEEFDKAVKESNFVAQRAYSAPDQDTLNAYKEQLYNGKWYVDCSTGGATYGSGMYAVPNYNGIIDKQMSNTMIQYQNRWGARPSTVETFTLTKDTKIITTSELQKIKSEFQAKAMEELNRTNWSKETMAKWDFISRNDDGVLATKLGYDAIKVDVKSSGDYQEIVILNRTKCIFKGE